MTEVYSFDEAREAWSKLHDGLRKCGMESMVIETLTTYFATPEKWITVSAPPAMDREAVDRDELAKRLFWADVLLGDHPERLQPEWRDRWWDEMSTMPLSGPGFLRKWRALADAALSTLSADAIHPDDIAVDRFAVLMKAKLSAARAKGRGGWDDPAQCSTGYLRNLLHEHVAKGDPIDVANFCMMLAHYGASTAISADAICQGEGLRALSDRATPGPWAWEQCGEMEDVPVVGIAFPGDDPDCKAPYEGEFRDSDANRMAIAFDWQSCDGHSPSANAAFAVAAVNFVRTLLTTPAPAVDAVPAGEVERLGEALFALSADLRASGFFADAARHANYERVVAAFAALDSRAGDAGERDAEVERIMALSDAEIMAEADAEDVAWARAFKQGLRTGQHVSTAGAPVKALRSIVAKHTRVGGYPDTYAIARDAYNLAAATSAPAVDAVQGWTPLDAWEELSQDDRTCPDPTMRSITFEELRMFMAPPQPGCICGEVEGENDECPVHGENDAVDAVPAGEDLDDWLRGDWYERWQDATENADEELMATLESLRGRVEQTIRAALAHGEGRK